MSAGKRLKVFRPGLTQTDCTATEDNQRLEITDLESRWIVLSICMYLRM